MDLFIIPVITGSFIMGGLLERVFTTYLEHRELNKLVQTTFQDYEIIEYQGESDESKLVRVMVYKIKSGKLQITRESGFTLDGNTEEKFDYYAWCIEDSRFCFIRLKSGEYNLYKGTNIFSKYSCYPNVTTAANKALVDACTLGKDPREIIKEVQEL